MRRAHVFRHPASSASQIQEASLTDEEAEQRHAAVRHVCPETQGGAGDGKPASNEDVSGHMRPSATAGRARAPCCVWQWSRCLLRMARSPGESPCTRLSVCLGLRRGALHSVGACLLLDLASPLPPPRSAQVPAGWGRTIQPPPPSEALCQPPPPSALSTATLTFPASVVVDTTLQTSRSWEIFCVQHCRRPHGRGVKGA